MQLQASIKVGNILPGRNPRGYFDPSEMTELEESVKSKGVLQPILVRPRDSGRYEIVAGERRWRAAKKVLGDDYEIPVLVRDLDDGEADEAALRRGPGLAFRNASAAVSAVASVDEGRAFSRRTHKIVCRAFQSGFRSMQNEPAVESGFRCCP